MQEWKALDFVLDGGRTMESVSIEQALKSALASSEMEGLKVTSEVIRNCQRLLNGEIDVDKLVEEIMNKPKEEE